MPLYMSQSSKAAKGSLMRPAFAIGILVLLLLPSPASAATRTEGDANHYQRCLALARKEPSAGFEEALAWQSAGGAHPAEHCAAVALFGLKQYGEAAARLEKLAESMGKAPPALLAGTLGQAGRGWLLAGEAARAAALLARAVAVAPDDPDLRIDQAEAMAASGNYAGAVAALDKALELDPRRAEALTYRASARRALGQLDPALRDAEAALKVTPDLSDALLERGNIRQLKGDSAGARQDWLHAAMAAPDSPAAAASRQNIEKLDLSAKPK